MLKPFAAAAVMLLLSSQEPALAPAASPVELGDAAMKKQSAKGYREALEHYRAARKAAPDDVELALKTAVALNAVMRTEGEGNLLLLEGTSDTPANKKLWRELGVEAVELADKARKAKPKDADALGAYAEAYMYQSSSFGIIKAILDGAADKYQENANALIKVDEKYDEAVGHVYLGSFFTVAPWPLSDGKKARAHFEKAVQLAPSSRNHYYLAVRYYRDDEWAKAAAHFEKAVTQECTLNTVDFCKAMKAEAKRGLEASRAKAR